MAAVALADGDVAPECRAVGLMRAVRLALACDRSDLVEGLVTSARPHAPRERLRLEVNGASGGVGTFAVQLAKALGAEVTAVCSERNLEVVRSIGPDHVVDYVHEDVTQVEPRFEVIMDIVGTHPLRHRRRVMIRGATYVMVGSIEGRFLRPIVYGKVLTLATGERFMACVAERSADDLADLAERIDAGQIAPVIERTYAMAEVPDAVRHLEGGHVAGKLVVTA